MLKQLTDNDRSPFALADIATDFRRVGESIVAGYALLPVDPTRRFVVEMLVDGAPVGSVRADMFDDRAKALGGDGLHGFSFEIASERMKRGRFVSARLANTDIDVGLPVDLKRSPISGSSMAGVVTWRGGLGLQGSIAIAADSAFTPRVRASINGRVVSVNKPVRWGPVEGLTKTGSALMAPFTLTLPSWVADGRMHRVSILDEDNRDLDGSPIEIGLQAGQQDAGSRFLRATPLAEWRVLQSDLFKASSLKRHIRVIAIGDRDHDATLASLKQIGDTSIHVDMLHARNGCFDWSDLRSILDKQLEQGFLVICRSGAIFEWPVLQSLIEAIDANPDCRLVYGDAAMTDAAGTVSPFFCSAYDHARMLEQGYAAHVYVLRSRDARIPAGMSVGSSEAFFLAQIESGDRAGLVHHHPGIVATIPYQPPLGAAQRLAQVIVEMGDGSDSRNAIKNVTPAAGDALPAVRIDRLTTSPCTIGVVIHGAATHGASEISGLFGSLDRKDKIFITTADGDLVGFGGSVASATRSVVAALNRLPSVDVVLFLDGAVSGIGSNEVDELASVLTNPDVSVVAPLQIDRAGFVAHAGYLFRPNMQIDDFGFGRHATNAGYGDELRVTREVSAVSWSCFMTRREDIEAVEGFEFSNYPLGLADIDFCLKQRRRGKRVIVTPHVKARRSSAMPMFSDGDESPTIRRSFATLRNAWTGFFLADPAYHPWLAADGPPSSGLITCPLRQPARTSRIRLR